MVCRQVFSLVWSSGHILLFTKPRLANNSAVPVVYKWYRDGFQANPRNLSLTLTPWNNVFRDRVESGPVYLLWNPFQCGCCFQWTWVAVPVVPTPGVKCVRVFRFSSRIHTFYVYLSHHVLWGLSHFNFMSCLVLKIIEPETHKLTDTQVTDFWIHH